MSTSLSPAVRCPQCSAHIRPGSEWCTLCYADLRPAAAPPVAEPPCAEPAAADDDPLPAGLVALPHDDVAGRHDDGPAPVGRRGKHARRAGPARPAADAEVEALAAQMLAELAATRRDNPLGRAAGALDTPAKRVGLMIGGTVAAMTVLFLLMAAVGALL